MDLNEYLAANPNIDLSREIVNRESADFVSRYNPHVIQPDEAPSAPVPETERISGYPSPSVAAQVMPGMTPNAGVSPYYSRGDHCHGTPPALAPTFTDKESLVLNHNFGTYPIVQIMNTGGELMATGVTVTHNSANPGVHLVELRAWGPENGK